MKYIFDQVPGVRIYMDDFFVWGSTKEEHDSGLHTALQLAKNAGLTLNASNGRFGVTEIDFLGHMISQDMIKPQTIMTKPLSEMPPPVDKIGVHRMLGVVNYFCKYIPHLAQRTTILRSLVKKDTVFELSENHSCE